MQKREEKHANLIARTGLTNTMMGTLFYLVIFCPFGDLARAGRLEKKDKDKLIISFVSFQGYKSSLNDLAIIPLFAKAFLVLIGQFLGKH